MSWGALHDLALHVGGMPPDRAIVFPIVVDLPALAAMLIALLVPAPSRFLRAFNPVLRCASRHRARSMTNGNGALVAGSPGHTGSGRFFWNAGGSSAIMRRR